MLLRILGPLEIRQEPRSQQPSRRLAKVLLGALALRANHAVSTSWLGEVLWSGRPPKSAAANLRSYAAYARRLLMAAGEPGSEAASIDCVDSRYVLRIATSDLDALQFRALVDEGRRALQDGHPELAAERLSRALGLWRGPVLDPIALPVAVESEVDDLRDLRLDAFEYRASARLELGEHEALVSELRSLVARHAFREQLWRQLLLALYRSGRQVEALDAYAEFRANLDRELGITPTPALRELHQRILRSDPTLDPVKGATVVELHRPGPRELPPPPHPFVGRAAALSVISQVATAADHPPAVIISGPPLAGTSAVAVQWAHQHADAYPDGQIYLDVMAYGGPKAAGLRLVERALAALGCDATRQSDAAGMEAAYRSALAERRVLVVVDNATSDAQVRPLLPGTSSSLVLVATSSDLRDVTVRNGAPRVPVGLLSAEESYELLRALVVARGGTLDVAHRRVLGQAVAICRGRPLAVRRLADLIDRQAGRILPEVVAQATLRPSWGAQLAHG